GVKRSPARACSHLRRKFGDVLWASVGATPELAAHRVMWSIDGALERLRRFATAVDPVQAGASQYLSGAITERARSAARDRRRFDSGTGGRVVLWVVRPIHRRRLRRDGGGGE